MSDERRPRFRNPFRPLPPASTDRTVTTEPDEYVPLSLRITASYAWRMLFIAAVIAVFIWLVITLKLLVIPFMVAILGIYILVVAQFGSFKLPLVILTPIPLTLIGILLGHWLFAAPFTATSSTGPPSGISARKCTSAKISMAAGRRR